MKATLVYDGENLIVPEEMGKPKEGQLEGTVPEKVAELCGRVCYDSLGKGRASEEYHKHIHEVGHYSVYEHTPITVGFIVNDDNAHRYYHCLLNRPGVFVHPEDKNTYLFFRVTANFRSIIEWDKFSNPECRDFNELDKWIGDVMKIHGHEIAPQIISEPEKFVSLKDAMYVEDNLFEQEKWVTIFMVGSRGFSHEQVRHGDSTAISQRSTRYVDESKSEWVWHPLIESYLHETSNDGFSELLEGVQTNCEVCYVNIVEALQTWLLEKGIDKFSARKQARGAARGFLGNALETEMMFSASVSQWKHMISMRATKYADAEIRQIYTEGVIPALQQSRYANDFAYRIEPSDDGIGHVAIDISEDT